MKTDYNPDGKVMGWQEYMKARKKMQSVQKKEMAPWLCRECGKSAYTLRAHMGKLFRTCKGCGDEMTF